MADLPNLASSFTGEIATDKATRQQYSRDASLFSVTPAAVVFPKSINELKTLVQYANDHENISLTVRSGGSDMSGGPLTESVVVDMNRHFNKLEAFHDQTVTVQPGLFYRDLEKETLKRNLLLPSYPASKNLCTVGGMVANNSGGEKTLAYGKTAKYVSALKAVLADGNEYELRPLTTKEFQNKMNQKDFEGEIYYRLATLIRDNEDLIQKARPQVSKNSSGYNLWDVWDGETFDITKLFVGSQGTLGIITDITFKLVHPKPHSRMLVMYLRTTEQLATIVERVLKHKPESFESYDEHTLKLAIKFFPQMIRLMKGSTVASLAWHLIPDILMMLKSGFPNLVLIAEFTGDDESEIVRRAHAAEAAVENIVAAARVTESEQEAEKYWTIRRESFNLLRKKVKNLKTAPFIDDFIVQPRHLPEFLPKLNAILGEYDIFFTVAGHVGDGNFHIIPLMDMSNPRQRNIIPELSQRVYDLVLKYDGSITAEHNDGLIRSPYIEQMFGPKMYKLFEEVKQIFDPKNIFNPGKKVHSSKQYALAHLIRD